MSDASLTLLLGGAVTFVVSVCVWQFQQGGRRRRKRRRLVEELDLLAKLDERNSLPVQRLRARVDKLLEQYEPDPHRVRVRRASWAAFLGSFVVLYGMYFIAVAVFELPSEGFIFWSVATGVTASLVDNAVVRRMERIEQDKAVDQAITLGTAVEHDEAGQMTVTQSASAPAEEDPK